MFRAGEIRATCTSQGGRMVTFEKSAGKLANAVLLR